MRNSNIGFGNEFEGESATDIRSLKQNSLATGMPSGLGSGSRFHQGQNHEIFTVGSDVDGTRHANTPTVPFLEDCAFKWSAIPLTGWF